MTHETFVSKQNLQDVLDGIETKIAGLGSTLTGIYTWKTSNQYKAGDVVIANGSLFICLTTHTSSSTFSTDIANWQLICSDIEDWQASTYYVVGACVINNKKIYRCKTAHTSGSTFDSTEEANWDAIGGGSTSINDWVASTSYNVGDFVIHSNKLYKCTTANNDSTWNATKWQGISIETEIKNWVASTSYNIGEFVIHAGSLYRCLNANNDATWTETNWTVISASNVGRTTTVLWSGKFNTVTPSASLTLSDVYSNYDELILNVGGTQSTITDPSMVSTIYQYSDGGRLGPTLASEILLSFSGSTATATAWSYGSALANLTVILYGRNYVIGSGGGTTIDDWATSTTYKAGDYARKDNVLYVCNTPHTSSTFTADRAKWDAIKVEDFTGATASTNGESGGVPKPMSWNKDNFLRGDGNWSAPYSTNVQTTTLYQGDYTNLVTGATLTLSGNVNDFDEIQLHFSVWPACQVANNSNQLAWAHWETDAINKDCGHVTFSGNTMNVTFHTMGTGVASTSAFKVVGINYTQVALNVGNFILWEGQLYTTSSSVTLSDTYSNYDKVRIYLMGNSNQVFGTTEIIPIRGDTIAAVHGSVNFSGFNEYDGYVTFSSNTATLSLAYGLSSTIYIGRIEGIRYYTSTTESNIPDFIGATSSVNGRRGMVPMPTTADIGKYLCGDGTWKSGIAGMSAVRKILWQGNAYAAGVLPLTDNYTDYDYIIVSMNINDAVGDSVIIDTSTDSKAFCSLCFYYGGDVIVSAQVEFSGNTATLTSPYGLSSGVLYISKIEGIKFVLPYEYSTTERRVGKWIDGKDIYQITYTGTGTATSATTNTVAIDVTSLGADNYIDIGGNIKMGDIYWPTNFYLSSTSWVSTLIGYNGTPSTPTIYLSTGTGIVGSLTYNITLRYTKP